MYKWNVASPNVRNVLLVALNDTNKLIYQLEVNGHTSVQLYMAPCGGQAIRLTPKQR